MSEHGEELSIKLRKSGNLCCDSFDFAGEQTLKQGDAGDARNNCASPIRHPLNLE